MDKNQTKKALLHDFHILAIIFYMKKTWEKGKANQSAVAPFQILAGYGENMEGNCNIIIFVTLF